jgi:predicted nucleotidyltransferase
MDVKYVEEHTIFEAIVGSQAYGISTPDSPADR